VNGKRLAIRVTDVIEPQFADPEEGDAIAPDEPPQQAVLEGPPPSRELPAGAPAQIPPVPEEAASG